MTRFKVRKSGDYYLVTVGMIGRKFYPAVTKLIKSDAQAICNARNRLVAKKEKK